MWDPETRESVCLSRKTKLCATIAENRRLGNLQRTEIYWPEVLEAEKFKVKVLAGLVSDKVILLFWDGALHLQPPDRKKAGYSAWQRQKSQESEPTLQHPVIKAFKPSKRVEPSWLNLSKGSPPNIAVLSPEAKRETEQSLPQSLQETTNPANTWSLDFQPSKLWKNKVPSFQGSKFVAFCYSDPRKLIYSIKCVSQMLWRANERIRRQQAQGQGQLSER